MPVYNAQKYLREAIDSILNQTFKDFEFLIINDASTDGSEKIILSYKDPRIRYYKNKKNMGVARTLDKGLRRAKGDYIARMDADDISRQDRIHLQYKKLREDERVAIVGSHALIIDEVGNPFEVWKGELTPGEIFYALQFRNRLVHSSVMFKKKIILDEFNGYSEKHEAEDYDLWLRVSKKYKICKINEQLIKLRIIKSGRTGSCGKKIKKDGLIIARDNLQTFINKPLSLETARILAGYHFLNFTPSKVKNALSLLQIINNKIIESHPPFLNKSVVRKRSEAEKRKLKLILMMTIIFHSGFGPVFKKLYKMYLIIKHNNL